MKNIKKILSLTVIISAILLLSACNPVENKSQSPSLLIVENILGKDIEGKAVNYLQSDVVINSTVIADVASTTLRAETMDPAPMLGTSPYNDILVTRYTVSYSRTDGRNVPGVDVPYPFEGSLSILVKVGTTTTFSFVVVREVAKLEPPLIGLVDGGAEGVLQVTAKIDFYGHDLTNNNVKATGYLAIYFANYVDQETTPPPTTQTLFK
jgi:uncharacterized lipoprotein YehR (DUF1307 family)